MRKFWAFKPGARAEAEAELWNEGEFQEARDWFWDGADATLTVPDEFRTNLQELRGMDLTVWVNSPGGDPYAGMAIYTLLMEHQGRKIAKIAGIAASAATLPLMACDEIWMSPASFLFIHEASTVARGREEDMERAKAELIAVNARMAELYTKRSGLSAEKIQELMHAETLMSPARALELNFADGVLYQDGEGDQRPAALITLKDIKWPRSALDDHEAEERKRIAAEALSTREAADRITWKPGAK